MTNNASDLSLSAGAHCAGGVCGPIDYDWAFQKPTIKAAEAFDEEDLFYFILNRAEDFVYRDDDEEEALVLFDEAYRLAVETESLGVDYGFGVMFQLHYFGYHDKAFDMCLEIAQDGLDRGDVGLLSDLWRLLPEMGEPGDSLNESALNLRHMIQVRYPEVMDHISKSRRL